MVELREYKTNYKDVPIILGIPGLVHAGEETRIDKILKELNKRKINGVRMNFSGIEKKADSIECNFNLDRYVEDISKAFKLISQESEKVGIITSSMASGIFSYFMSQNPANISSLVSISPAAGWPYYASSSVRKNLENNPRNLEITSLGDQDKGIKRIITKEGLLELIKTDGLEALRKSYQPTQMKVLTLAGKDDRISDYASMREYHRLLGGEPERFLEYESGHNIYLELCKDAIGEFLRNTLYKKNDRKVA